MVIMNPPLKGLICQLIPRNLNLALEESSPKTGRFCFLSEKSFINETGRSQGHVQKDVQGCQYIKNYVISWPHVSYSISFFRYEDSRKHRRKPWWPWISTWMRFANAVLLRLVVQHQYRGSKRTRLRFHLIGWYIWQPGTYHFLWVSN